jgi:hypothetical protein
MEEFQERDSSYDEERQTIDDHDMEDSPTDTVELWMTDRNDEDTKFDCSGEEKVFQRYDQGGVWRHRLPQSPTSTWRRSARGDLEQ